MQKISLKEWVVLLTIVPTTIISIAIAGFFTYTRHAELNDFLTSRATSIIEPIALTSAKDLISRNRKEIRKLINFAHRNHSNLVKNITVFTADNQVFVTSAYHGESYLIRLKPGELIPEKTVQEEMGEYIIFRSPIINEFTDETNSNDLLEKDVETIGYVAMQVDQQTMQLAQQNHFIIAFLIIIVGIFIAAIFTIRLIKNVTVPISSMVQAVDKIREGKLESRVSGHLIGELSFLKNGINAMAQSLGDFHNDMQRSIDQATLDLRESCELYEEQNVELDIARKKAEDANKVKSEFLANMSHELRTPLNGVIGFTRQVLKTPLTDLQRDFLQTIDGSANNLLTIINDILDFSKLDAGKMTLENIPFSLQDTIEETIVLLAPSAHKKNIELSFCICSEISDALIGDALRIKQILLNLANNAIKFTDNGSVTIDIKQTKTIANKIELMFEINDTGIGMNEEQQKSLFEAFGQADKSITRLYGGTGLGLIISQRLSQEMSGDIGFTSEEGKGSLFWFSCQCELNPIQIGQTFDNNDIRNKKIIYLEEHAHCRITINKLLTAWEMDVITCESIVGLSKVLTEIDDIDYLLIGHNTSPAAMNDLKDLVSSLTTKVPHLIVAINSSSPNLQEAIISAGANTCLSKPIIPSRLLKALQPNQSIIDAINQNQLTTKVPIKVLAVDDNEANLKLIETLLLEHVSDVTTASNGQQAVEMCKNEKFAIIFMDIQMPIMDGAKALEIIKAYTFNESTPIIAVTAHALESEKEKLLQQGFNSYMTKPINESMLKHTIYEYCDNDLFRKKEALPLTVNEFIEPNKDIDWSLALKRASNKEDLAKDMLAGLIKSLPETKIGISEAIYCQDTVLVKTLVHKLNGACCYSGVPNLGNIVHQIETQLKQGASLDELEPEFFEFYEHIDNLLEAANNFID